MYTYGWSAAPVCYNSRYPKADFYLESAERLTTLQRWNVIAFGSLTGKYTNDPIITAQLLKRYNDQYN